MSHLDIMKMSRSVMLRLSLNDIDFDVLVVRSKNDNTRELLGIPTLLIFDRMNKSLVPSFQHAVDCT